MDELVIGDQTYISSKRAAEITGYAKDYVGQLCREGRVEARLVGRSWYVREAAIRDHRFGAQNEPEKNLMGQTEVGGTEQDTPYTGPKYETEIIEEITTPIEDVPEVTNSPADIVAEKDPEETTKNIHKAWESWFAENPQVEEEEPVQIERVHDQEVVKEEIPITITRVEPEQEQVAPEPVIREVIYINRSRPILRLLIVLIGVSVIAITAISTGFLGLPRYGITATVLDYLSGSTTFEK